MRGCLPVCVLLFLALLCQDVVINYFLALTVGSGAGIQHQFRLHRRGDVVRVVGVAGEVQLLRDRLVARCGLPTSTRWS